MKITGNDLIKAGSPQGPALGEALKTVNSNDYPYENYYDRDAPWRIKRAAKLAAKLAAKQADQNNNKG
jgi:hypothetical protein